MRQNVKTNFQNILNTILSYYFYRRFYWKSKKISSI